MTRPVHVVGAGMTPFRNGANESAIDMAAEACYRAIDDASVAPSDVEYAACGNALAPIFGEGSIVGQAALRDLGITGIPVANVHNGAATGAQAFREAYLMIAAGLCNVAVAFGAERMCHVPLPSLYNALANAGDTRMETANGLTWPALGAMITRRRMHEVGGGRDQYANTARIHHENACKNPYAQRQEHLTVEEVKSAPIVADPMTLYELSPRSDGGAAVVLACKEVAESLPVMPVEVAATVQTSGHYRHDEFVHKSLTSKRAADQIYEKSDITPETIDLVEIHDAFSVQVATFLEALGFADESEGERVIARGDTEIDGRIPFCPSGGLLARGHPIGASGIAQICEVVWQLRDNAGERQVPDADTGMTQMTGGFIHTQAASSIVNVFTRA